MAEDFQAQPPPGDARPAQGLPAYDRFEQVSLRKPENEGAVRWPILVLGGIFAFVAVALAMLASWWQAGKSVSGGSPNTAPERAPAPIQAVAAQDDGWAEHWALQDTWQATAMVVNGEKATLDDVTKVNLTLAGKEFVLVLPRTKYEGEWLGVCDLTTKPRRMELAGDNFNLQAIYRLDGDTMTFCFTALDGDRPTEFTAEKGSGRTLLMLKRQEKKR